MNTMDLHTHSPYSDGTHAVRDMLCKAEALHLRYFSVSDHNTVDAYKEIAAHRALFSGKIIPAVELTTTYYGETIEILSYGVDPAAMAPFIQKNYPDNNTKRIREAGIMATTLVRKGVRLSEAFVRRMCEDPESFDRFHQLGCRPYFLAEMRNFPENQRFFESEAHFRTVPAQEYARNYWFNPHFELYVDLSGFYPSFQQVLDQIHQLNGLAFLAHLYVYSQNITCALEDIITHYPLDGLETHYGTFTPEQITTLSDFCTEHRLFQSGGSDYHGTDVRPHNIMGHAAGAPILAALAEPWLHRIRMM